MRNLTQFGGVAFVIALVVLIPLAGCGGGGGGGTVNPPAESFRAVIGAAGGTITADSGSLDGVVFTVAPGAVAAETTFILSPGTDIATQVGDLLVGPSIRILPEGTTFSDQVTLKIPFDLSRVPAGQGTVRMEVLHRDAAGEVRRLPISEFPAGEGAVVVDVPSLSTFQPSLPPLDVGGFWLFGVIDGPLTVTPLPTPDDLSTGTGDIFPNLETGEVTFIPKGATDVNDDPITFTGTFSGNLMTVSATYIGDEGQVTETVMLEFLSEYVGYGTLTETLSGGQPTVAQIVFFRATNLDPPTYTTSPTVQWNLLIDGGAASDPLLPSSGLMNSQKTATLLQLPPDPDSGLTGITMFLSDDILNPFIGIVTGEYYVFGRQRAIGGGTLVEVFSFNRSTSSVMSSGVALAPGFAWWWGEGTIDNPPADPSSGNFGTGVATMTEDI